MKRVAFFYRELRHDNPVFVLVGEQILAEHRMRAAMCVFFIIQDVKLVAVAIFIDDRPACRNRAGFKVFLNFPLPVNHAQQRDHYDRQHHLFHLCLQIFLLQIDLRRIEIDGPFKFTLYRTAKGYVFTEINRKNAGRFVL